MTMLLRSGTVRVLSRANAETMNPTRSLLPCVAAHLAKNLGVVAVKYAQGFVGDWW